jgi:hypothetical protein
MFSNRSLYSELSAKRSLAVEFKLKETVISLNSKFFTSAVQKGLCGI